MLWGQWNALDLGDQGSTAGASDAGYSLGAQETLEQPADQAFFLEEAPRIPFLKSPGCVSSFKHHNPVQQLSCPTHCSLPSAQTRSKTATEPFYIPESPKSKTAKWSVGSVLTILLGGSPAVEGQSGCIQGTRRADIALHQQADSLTEEQVSEFKEAFSLFVSCWVIPFLLALSCCVGGLTSEIGQGW